MVVARAVGAGLLAAACSAAQVPNVLTVEHPSTAKVVAVEYPPPPAKVEEVGAPPSPDCAWRDGYWEWVGRQWEWTPGAWVVSPAGCRFAPRIILVWLTKEKQDTLYYGRPRWYRTDGRHGTCEERVCRASTAR